MSLPTLILFLLSGSLLFVAMPPLLPAGHWAAHYALVLWLPVWWIAGLMHGGARLGTREPWVARLVRFSRFQVVEWGGGAYAAIALVAFGWLEWARLNEFWQALLELAHGGAARDFVRGLFDFGIDSFMNGIFAFVWPAFWKKAFHFGQMWPAAAIAWGVYEAARWGVKLLAGDDAPRAPRPPRHPQPPQPPPPPRED